MIQFLCADDSGDEEEKEELIKVESMSINVYDRSGDGDITRVDFMNI